MRRAMRQEMLSIRLPPPFAKQDTRVPRQSTTALPVQRIGWMLRRHSSKITTWVMHSTACGGLLAAI